MGLGRVSYNSGKKGWERSCRYRTLKCRQRNKAASLLFSQMSGKDGCLNEVGEDQQ